MDLPSDLPTGETDGQQNSVPYQNPMDTAHIPPEPARTFQVSSTSSNFSTKSTVSQPPQEQPPQEEPENQTPGTAVKIIVLIALIILLVVGILLPIKLVPNAISSISSSLSSLFASKSSAPAKISVAPTNPASGQAFTLAWSGSHLNNGSYAIGYPCIPNVSLQSSINQPNETVTCNAPFYFSTDKNNLNLTATTPANQTTYIPIIISFLPNGGSPQVVASTTLTILGNATSTAQNNSAPQSATSTSAGNQPSQNRNPQTGSNTTASSTGSASVSSNSSSNNATSTGTISNPNGLPDLAISITSVGYLNTYNNFVPSTYVPANGRVAIKFVVKNIGTKSSGSWNFTAYLPDLDHPTYTASNQRSIAPGGDISYTLSYDNYNPSTSNLIKIIVDPNNSLTESSKANNTASVKVTQAQ